MQTERKQRKSAFYTFERQENYAQSAPPPVSDWVHSFVEVRFSVHECLAALVKENAQISRAVGTVDPQSPLIERASCLL